MNRYILIKRQVLIGAAAGMGLLGATATAQQTPDKGREPSARERAPEGNTVREPRASQRQQGSEHPKSSEQPGKDQPRRAERPDKDRPKTTDQPGKDRPKAADRPDKDSPKTTDQLDNDRAKGAKGPDRDRPKTTDQPGKNRPKAADRPDKDRPKTTDQPDNNRPKGAERPDRTKPGLAQPDTDKGAPGRARLSEQQRGEVGSKLRQTRVEKTRVQVNVNIGSRIPGTVRFNRLPSTIVALVPAYRGHSYFVREDDTIVIVDARTHVVVDVIPATTRVAELSLSPDQMRFIFARVPKDRSVDIRVRLALGAEVPRDVELLAFPGEVVARIPEMERYRYVVADRDVAIVDPADNAVVLVISE